MTLDANRDTENNTMIDILVQAIKYHASPWHILLYTLLKRPSQSGDSHGEKHQLFGGAATEFCEDLCSLGSKFKH